MRDIDPNTVHRGLLESLLNKSNFEAYTRLCRFQELDKQPFYDFLIRKRECQQLIKLVNAMNSGLDRHFIEELPGYLIRHSHLDLLKLATAENFDELLSGLKGTKYFKALKKVKRLDDGNIDATDCELKLRIFYYESLFEDIEKSLSDSDGRELKKIILTETDIINIINAYRMKAYFGMNGEQIRSAQLPFTRIGKNAMNSLYQCETPDEMIGRLEKTVYGRQFQGDYEHIETKVNLYIYHLMKHTVSRTTSAPVAIYAFMRLCDIEVSNIVHIIEGVRYGVEPAMIEKLIVC